MNIKVMLIEDDETARRQLARVIGKEGFDVISAEDGCVGLEKFKNESPEIIITDLKMAKIDGMEVLHTIKRLKPKTQVIVITAYGEIDTAINALRDGALDYLKKPLDLDKLSVALGRAKEKVTTYKKIDHYPIILLADDDTESRKRLARVLEKEGWIVYQANNGEEALDTFKKIKIDIILLDIKMPKKDGLTTLSEMREISDDFEAIILTGYGDEGCAVQAMRSGAINFIKKPIDLDQMIVAVEKAVEKQNSERSLKYRIRELELSREIIARITAENEIIIDVSNRNKDETKQFALDILDNIPMHIVLFEEDMGITYINKSMADSIEGEAKKFNEDFVKNLNDAGIRVPYEETVEIANKLFNADTIATEKIQTGGFSYVTLTSVSFVHEKNKKKIAMMAVQGLGIRD